MAWQKPYPPSSSRDGRTTLQTPWVPKGSDDRLSADLLIRANPRNQPTLNSSYNEKTLPAKHTHARPPSHKYSRKWLSWKWKQAVKRGKWPRVIYAIFGLLLIGGWMGVTTGFALDEAQYQRSNLKPSHESRIFPNNTANGDGLLLQGSLKWFDPAVRQLDISWTPMWADTDGNPQPFGTNSSTTYAIGIWRDQRLIPEYRPGVEDVNRTLFPLDIYTVDNTTAPPNAVVGLHPWDSFHTTIDMGQEVQESPWRQPLFGFPFDSWSGQVTFVANFMDIALIHGLNNSFGLPVHQAYLSDSLINWRVTASIVNTCEINGDFWPRYETVDFCELTVKLSSKRPGLVILGSLVAVAVNWISTIFIFIMTCEGVVMHRASVIEGPQLLAVCFTALFALPSVRSILPGAPEFGALSELPLFSIAHHANHLSSPSFYVPVDLIGIVPNVIIISLCTTAVAIETLRDMHRKSVVSIE